MNTGRMTTFGSPPSGAGVRELTIPPHVARPGRVARTISPAVEALRADPTTLEAFWREITDSGTPLIEGQGSERIYTFLYRGEAKTVGLITNKIVDDTTFEDALLERIAGTDVWAVSLCLGSAWRGSYQLAVVDGAPSHLNEAQLAVLEQRRARSRAATPADRHLSIDAWYELLRHARPDALARERGISGSVAAGPDAPAAVTPARAAQPGRIVPVEQSDISAWWYLPADEPEPDGWNVLVMLDGDRWIERGTHLLDALAATGALPQTAVLLIGHGELLERVAQLTCNPEFIDQICDLLSAPPSEVGRVTASATRTTITGQSLGGLTALYAQCLAPERFGASVCQSGSFWWPNPRGGHPAEWITKTLEASEASLGRIHLEVGTDEWVLLEPTRRLRKALEGRCEVLNYSEFDGGHDAACWTISLPRALRALRDA